jgi:hemolysin activation/secretion protein
MQPRFARLLAGSVLAAAVTAAWGAEAPADGAVRFDIQRFDISGNTLLPQSALEAAVAPFAGKGRDFGDVQSALEALEALYHARGYKIVSVRLPEQELNGGVVRLIVVQTKIARVVIKGQRFVGEDNVRRAMPSLVPGQSPDLNAVSANLKLANDNPARKISMKLQSAEADDAVDALLEVADEKPWKAMLNLDNTGTEQTGKTHVSAVLQHANLFGRDHLATFQYTTTAEKPSQVSVYGMGYHIPLYALGDTLDLYANYSNVDSGSVTAGAFDVNVSGKGAVYGARYGHVLERQPETERRLVYGVDVKAFKNSVLVAGTNIGNDITVHPLSVEYLVTKSAPTDELNMSATLLHNIPGGSRGAQADFARVRAGAKAGYTMLRFAAAYTRAFSERWQLRVLANGQLSGDALVPGEQFGAGGSSSVRGFEERVLSADSGLVLNTEIYGPNFCGEGRACRMVAFYDVAHGKRNKALAGEAGSATIRGAGLGVRLSLGASASMQADWGRALKEGSVGSAGNSKLHVRVSFAY